MMKKLSSGFIWLFLLVMGLPLCLLGGCAAWWGIASVQAGIQSSQAHRQVEPLSTHLQEVIPASERARVMFFSPDGRQLIVSTQSDALLAVDVQNGAQVPIKAVGQKDRVTAEARRLLAQSDVIYQKELSVDYFIFLTFTGEETAVITLPMNEPGVTALVSDLSISQTIQHWQPDRYAYQTPVLTDDRLYSPDGRFYVTTQPEQVDTVEFTRLFLFAADTNTLLAQANYSRSRLRQYGWAYDSSGIYLLYEGGYGTPWSPVFKLLAPITK